MDPTEDLSARVLLKHILSTEPPRTPITRSASKTQSSSATRRSKRVSNKDAGGQTPQDILRRSLKHKIRESITRKSLPATKRRTASAVLRSTNTPAPSSMLFDDGDTPRHMLMNILRTEPVRSPVVHEKTASEEPQPSSANSSITSKRPSIELSGLDLPDITISNAASTAKRLSRKRPRRSLNVTAFERRLKDGGDLEEENEELTGDHSSLSLSSSTSLSLKTPYVDVQTEKRGLQRRVSNRRKITEDEFGAAVNKRQMGGASSFALVEQGLSETAYSEGFTLGLSKLSEPDITTDIVHCNTALYAQPDAMTSNFSIIATQDKPTVMASQLQRQMIEMEQSKLEKEKSLYAFPAEEGVVEELQNEEHFFQTEEDVDAAESQKEEGKSTAEDQPEDAAAMLTPEEEEGTADSHTNVKDDTAESEEDENRVEAQTEEEGVADSQTEEEEVAVDSQTKGEGTVDSLSEEEEVAADSQTEEEEGVVDSESEEDKNVAEYQSDREDPATNSQSEEEGGLADSQPEFEHDGEQEEEDGEQASEQLGSDLEHIDRRAHRSEGGLIMPVAEAEGDLADATEAGCSDGKSKAHSAIDLHSSLGMGSHESGQPNTGIPDLAESLIHEPADASCSEAEPGANEENSSSAAQDSAEQQGDWEDDEEGEESDEVPSKTPAFVKQKRNIFHSDPLASPSVLKDIQASSTSEGLPPPKRKQVRKRTGPAEKKQGLPKSYLMGVFKHFAKTKVSADVYPVLKEIMDKFFERLAEDLETYAIHAKRKTIEVEDAELLLKRQGHVNDKVPVEVLIEKYLRMDQRKLLIPIATSGNVVIPKKRR